VFHKDAEHIFIYEHNLNLDSRTTETYTDDTGKYADEMSPANKYKTLYSVV
jgi:hypothetical protein